MLISELLRRRPNEALLFLCMSDLADGEKVLETTQKELSEYTGMSRSQVRTAMKNLVTLGVISVEVFNRRSHREQQLSRVSFLYRADSVMIAKEEKPQQERTLFDVTEEKEEKPKATFKKPTIEEVERYVKEKGYTTFTAQEWYDHYESNGWFVGRTKMKDWKAAVRTWHSQRKRYNQDNPTKGMNQVEKANYEQQQRVNEYAKAIASHRTEPVGELPF